MPGVFAVLAKFIESHLDSYVFLVAAVSPGMYLSSWLVFLMISRHWSLGRWLGRSGAGFLLNFEPMLDYRVRIMMVRGEVGLDGWMLLP